MKDNEFDEALKDAEYRILILWSCERNRRLDYYLAYRNNIDAILDAFQETYLHYTFGEV